MNVLLIRHEAQDGEDGKTGDEAGATIQQTERQAISATQKTLSLKAAFLSSNLKRILGLVVLTPVAVIVVFVVAAQSRQGAQADGVGEEDLGAGVHPHLTEESF